MFTPPRTPPLPYPAPSISTSQNGRVGQREVSHSSANATNGLYTPEQRRKRDASPWTFVQGILAPVQCAICFASVGLILHYLVTGQGLWLATGSAVVKTVALYTIMITGSIWEKEVFGCYLFAPAFYWEDVVSILVLVLHTAYLAALFSGVLQPHGLLALALVAYATYAINAVQFLLKLRAARLGRPISSTPLSGAVG